MIEVDKINISLIYLQTMNHYSTTVVADQKQTAEEKIAYKPY